MSCGLGCIIEPTDKTGNNHGHKHKSASQTGLNGFEKTAKWHELRKMLGAARATVESR